MRIYIPPCASIFPSLTLSVHPSALLYLCALFYKTATPDILLTDVFCRSQSPFRTPGVCMGNCRGFYLPCVSISPLLSTSSQSLVPPIVVVILVVILVTVFQIRRRNRRRRERELEEGQDSTRRERDRRTEEREVVEVVDLESGKVVSVVDANENIPTDSEDEGSSDPEKKVSNPGPLIGMLIPNARS